MARYTGPKHKLARREGVNILDKTSPSLLRRLNIPPGMHGAKRKKQSSEFRLQLREKQKAKAVYGLLEKQFSRLVHAVQRRKGETDKLLVTMLETRLDTVVYRLGFAKTRFAARQLVAHGHVAVNGKRITIPSYQVKPDDVVSISLKMQQNPHVVKTIEEKKETLPFLERKGTSGRLLRLPTREDVEVPFDTRLIIEYYSR